MVDLHVNREMLERFETALDLRHPERCAIPARVLAFGKGCTILALEDPATSGLVFKRMAIFRSEKEAAHYETVLHHYVHALGQRIGIRVAPSTTVRISNPTRKQWPVYIIQERMPEASLGHHAIGDLPPSEMNRLALAALEEAAKVYDFNRTHLGDLELGIDGRISNWAINGFESSQPALPNRLKLNYLDIGTPLMRRREAEQFDPAPLLRAFPAIARPLVRRTLLPDMMSRYYDFRRVALDLLSSILKEGYGDFLSMLADSINWFFLAERQEMHFRPLTVQEIVRYHRRDIWLWRSYLLLRRYM